MSHFSVAVFHKVDESIDELLAPYDENLEVEPYLNGDGIYTTYNPNSKWDWFEIGGRFSKMLINKNTREHVDFGRVKDIVFPFDGEEYERRLKFWDANIDNAFEPEEKQKYPTFFKPEYYKEYYTNREDYARRTASFTTYAVIFDGQWYQKGNMGWWGISDDTPEDARNWDDNYKSRFIDSADPDWYVTIVDCHI